MQPERKIISVMNNISIPPRSAVLLIDKPYGWTSHDVVAKLRRLLGIRKIGHAGTLDPMATGLLVLALGQATRLLQFLSGMDKDYEGEATFGATSDTYDALGTLTITPSAKLPTTEELDRAAAAFRGDIQQIPPAHSAIKIGGRRAYDLARAGQAVEIKPRSVRIERLDILDYHAPAAKFFATVSSGTYIRSIAHDLGQSLGCGAYLSALRRTRVGHFRVEDAVAPEAEMVRQFSFITMAKSVSHLPQIELLDDANIQRLMNGMQVPCAPSAAGETVAALDAQGELIAIGRVDQHACVFIPALVFPYDANH